ncbi:phosphoribosylglycinamide formyltransferase [Parathalassolituus penaei]|uniref:Phosphoribosylglycinamide formyltransferase n=1 Tax=Parathalassolituus penaei TaxID=2997323 RepID=A0A9X3IT10_9GAMM|nr:phosphoribosylglycinamide formyltransferase [Parathalassolituus penaei]MCY0965810.1 phosphoribosylglycinamide formyltransferase [Parathalassolituus penaei]
MMVTDSIPETPRLVILISGTGSNMLALVEACRRGDLDATVAGVISNRPDAAGVQHARDRDIPALVVDHKEFSDRLAFDKAMMDAIDEFDPDLVVLAGFMRILTPEFVRHYQGRLLNIHPSLLPLYPGLNTHQRAIDAGDSTHGVSVHFVTEELDGGPVVAQAVVSVTADDSANSLKDKVHAQEHVLYPIVVKWFVEGRLRLTSKSVTLDGKELPASGLRLDAL